MDVIINPHGSCNFCGFQELSLNSHALICPISKICFLNSCKTFSQMLVLTGLVTWDLQHLHLKYCLVNHDYMLMNDENRKKCNSSDALIYMNKGSCSRSMCQFFDLFYKRRQAPFYFPMTFSFPWHI